MFFEYFTFIQHIRFSLRLTETYFNYGFNIFISTLRIFGFRITLSIWDLFSTEIYICWWPYVFIFFLINFYNKFKLGRIYLHRIYDNTFLPHISLALNIDLISNFNIFYRSWILFFITLFKNKSNFITITSISVHRFYTIIIIAFRFEFFWTFNYI